MPRFSTQQQLFNDAITYSLVSFTRLSRLSQNTSVCARLEVKAIMTQAVFLKRQRKFVSDALTDVLLALTESIELGFIITRTISYVIRKYSLTSGRNNTRIILQ